MAQNNKGSVFESLKKILGWPLIILWIYFGGAYIILGAGPSSVTNYVWDKFTSFMTFIVIGLLITFVLTVLKVRKYYNQRNSSANGGKK